MAKAKGEVNRSEQIRAVYAANPSMSPKEVVDTLAGQGIQVSIHLVYKVKKMLNKEKKKRFPAKAKPVSTATGSDDVNKSAEIRAVLEKSPKASAKEVVATLADQGVSVTGALVYNVRQQMKKSKKKSGRKAKASVPATQANGHIGNGAPVSPIHAVLKVKDLANQLGGLKSLKQLVDALAE